MKWFIDSICDGSIFSLEKVNDPIFRDKMLGDGLAFLPEGDKLYSPCNGEIQFVYPTGHSIGLKTSEGIEILIHFGFGTFKKKNGKIKGHVSVGQKIQQGDLLISFERQYFLENEIDMITSVIFVSGEQVVIEKEDFFVKAREKDVAYVMI